MGADRDMATPPRKLSPRHQCILVLTAAGLKRAGIARQVGINISTVTHVRRAPAFRDAIARLMQHVEEGVAAELRRQIVGPAPLCPRCHALPVSSHRTLTEAAAGPDRA